MINDDDTPLETSEACARPFRAPPRAAPAAPAADPQELWLYDMSVDGQVVRNWSTPERSLAFAPGCLNQRRFLPAAPAGGWPVRGARVDVDTVVIVARGRTQAERNAAARWMCGAVLAQMEAQ